MTTTFVLPYRPVTTPRFRPRFVCSTAPPDDVRAAHPLSRSETQTLLSRMLAVAIREEDYGRAAQVRDSQRALESIHPTHGLRRELEDSLKREDYAKAASIRNEIERVEILNEAERVKPKYPLGFVVLHRRLGYRMVLFGADFRCRARRCEDVGVQFSKRGVEQPWYHAAVDERDKEVGDNVIYVAEDDCIPASPGVEVVHPITKIMFRGLYSQNVCPGYSWYVPVGCTAGDGVEEHVEEEHVSGENTGGE